VVGVAGFEPATLRLSSACSNQLSYTPGKSLPEERQRVEQPGCCHSNPFFSALLKVEAWGFEPQTYSLQSYRSTN
jgi:hypothetical protein